MEELKGEVNRLTTKVERLIRVLFEETQKKEEALRQTFSLTQQLSDRDEELTKLKAVSRRLKSKYLDTLDQKNGLVDEVAYLHSSQDSPNIPSSSDTRNVSCQTNLTLIFNEVYPHPTLLECLQPFPDCPSRRFPKGTSITSSVFPRFHPSEYDPATSEHYGPLPRRHNRDPQPSTSRPYPVQYPYAPSVNDYTR